MFEDIVAFQNLSEVDWDDVSDTVPDEVRKGFPEVRERLKASLPFGRELTVAIAVQGRR
jgi:hypothetical protein